LPAEAQPFLLDHARAVARGDIGGAVAASRVHDDDLVGEAQAFEAGLEDIGCVAGDEDCGER
jgi:hypothetical protein